MPNPRPLICDTRNFSPNQTAAMTALKMGTLEFINEVKPALKVNEAYESSTKEIADPITPLTSNSHQYFFAISRASFLRKTGARNTPAKVIRNATKGTGPKSGAEIRMKRKEAPHRPASTKRINKSPIRM